MSDGVYEPYFCKACGFVIGFTHRVGRRSKLSVMRHGVSRRSIKALGDPQKIEFAVSDLECGTVHCMMCNAAHQWHISNRALEELLKRRELRTFGLD